MQSTRGALTRAIAAHARLVAWLDWRGGLFEWPERRHHTLRLEGDDHFSAEPQLGFERKGSAVQIDQVLRDRQTKAGALFGRLDRVGALAERGEHDRDLVVGNARPVVLYTHV